MFIPRVWNKLSGDGTAPDGSTVAVSVWGWGRDASEAGNRAAERLRHVMARIARGEGFPDSYGYGGNRPPKEEILREITDATQAEPVAVITRNGYGAQVLNTARLLFLDIDLRPDGVLRRLMQWFGAPTGEKAALTKLRNALQQYGRTTFRIYRTAAGLRVIAVDREFEPQSDAARQLMQATGTDPAFSRLCRVQGSFRARLTPKPWRCNCTPPSWAYPRSDDEERRFSAWLSEYEKMSTPYATCRYIETVGKGIATGMAKELLMLHDSLTGAGETLPLA